MDNNLQVTPISLTLTFSLVLIAFVISYKEQLKLEKDLIIAMARMVIQLLIVGYLLAGIFRMNQAWVTLAMVAVIVFNAAWNAAQRGRGMDHVFKNSVIALTVTSAITIMILIFSGSLKFIPAQIIPITGMIAGNTMKAIGICYQNLKQLFHDRQQGVLEMLALGATPKQAASDIFRLTIRSGMQPTIDSAKTTGLVSLPGMMSGLMFAGIDPTKAILYQIMVMFMLVGATAIGSFIATYLSYKTFFNQRAQLMTHRPKD
ncbi:ABC transporter permease [Vaginisenegalia massiliensis]|uniref:ABC transporter permease n=1 Tax=Vaginisenegalia massiliensis TaxID=2058294 RepID=UPI000F54243C|nr:iron export ABC transporter permease subunit FetB [Vaginisenegalia massiliensis]